MQSKSSPQRWRPDLALHGGPKYRAIVEALAAAIARGELVPGDRLPTHRDLAWDLGVNVSTVSDAYREARRRHLIDGEVGRGTFVLAGSAEASLFALKQGGGEDRIDLSTILPAPDPAWAEEDFASSLSPAERAGYRQPERLERAAMAAARCLTHRGLSLRPAQVIPVAGAQQGLLAVLLGLAGSKVLIEELAFPGIKALARTLGITLVPVAMDGEGVLPEALDRQARRSGARIAVLVPNMQNPTGAVMGEARRRDVAAVMERRGLTLIEDDVYGGLGDVPPLALLVPEQTIIVSSLSKTVAPGVRFGFIGGPDALLRELRGESHLTNWDMTPDSLALACDWVERGVVAARTDWQRSEVAARWRLACDRLGLSRGGAQPGPHLWLARGGDSEAVAARAREAGVDVVPAATFAVGRVTRDGLRVSLTTPPTRHRLSVGLERLASVL